MTPEQHKFVAKLMGFDFELRYRPGKQNLVGDALSRREEVPALQAITGPMWEIWDLLCAATEKDLEAKKSASKFNNKKKR